MPSIINRKYRIGFFLLFTSLIVSLGLGLPLLSAKAKKTQGKRPMKRVHKVEKKEDKKAETQPESKPEENKEVSKPKEFKHPFDIFPHDMHMDLFEAASVKCETCHADPDSFADHSKINKMGCHLCHNNPKDPPMPASQDCNRCHPNGRFPKPQTHRVDWMNKHQIFAKQDPKYCGQCHQNAMFCLDCHKRRDTVQERVHRRNFKFFHSIEARGNPRRCDACHTVNYCQQCHSGREDSKR